MRFLAGASFTPDRLIVWKTQYLSLFNIHIFKATVCITYASTTICFLLLGIASLQDQKATFLMMTTMTMDVHLTEIKALSFSLSIPSQALAMQRYPLLPVRLSRIPPPPHLRHPSRPFFLPPLRLLLPA